MSKEIQNKLLQFEAEPSLKVWDRIAIALDENELPTVREKLLQFETSPSSNVWNKIADDLDKIKPAVIVPFYKKFARPLKYGSAVAIFIVMAMVVSLLINKKTISSSTVENFAAKNNDADEKTQPKQAETYIVDKDEKIAVQTFYKQERITSQNKINSFTLNSSARQLITSIENLIPKIAERKTAITFNAPVDKYMVYSSEDGDAVKLPKKLFDVLACKAQDAICKQKLKLMQEKFAASALTADFSGVLDILNNMGENQ